MSNYIAGPWRWWTSCSFRRLSSDATGKDGDVLHASICSDGQPDITIHGGEDGPTARLIAAAPDLLEALRECVIRLEIHSKHTEDLVALMGASKAIAKATGEP